MLRSVGQVQADLLCEAGDGGHGPLAPTVTSIGYQALCNWPRRSTWLPARPLEPRSQELGVPGVDPARFRGDGGQLRLTCDLGDVLRCEGLKLFLGIHVHGKIRLGVQDVRVKGKVL